MSDLQNTSTPNIKEKRILDLIHRRDFSQAKLLLEERIKFDPRSADSFYLMGVLYYFQGQLGNTAKFLRQALEIDPSHTDSAICLSVLYNDIGKYDNAKQVFEKANLSVSSKQNDLSVGINKKFAVKHLEIADLYFRYRRYEEAIEEYSKAAALDPTAYEIQIRRAKAFAKKGFITRALQDLQRLKAEVPTFVPGRIQLGLLHYSQGNYLDAELEWEASQKLSPNNSEIAEYLKMVLNARSK